MQLREVPLRESAGVTLIQIDDVEPTGGFKATGYRLASLRQTARREFTDEGEAQTAFDLEVVACLSDPAIARLVAERGG